MKTKFVKDIIKKSLNNIFVFRTLQSKIAVILGIVSILISFSSNIKLLEILVQFITFYFIAKNIDCMIYGKCVFKSWFLLLLPILGVVLTIFYKFNLFKEYHKMIEDKVEKINNLNYRSNYQLLPYKNNLKN